MSVMVDHKIPFSRALLWILLSTLLVSGSVFMGWLYYLQVREHRLHDDQYRIVAIVQSTPQIEALKTVYLAELLDLSLDRPVNLYQFNAKEAERQLLVSPLIKEATVKKILPGTLYIYYETRTPIAYLGDFTNTAIDEEGYLFPFHPFFTPKRLPILYFGLDREECEWGGCLKSHPYFPLIFNILQQLNPLGQEKFLVKQLDLSHARADSYGQRQMIVMIEEIGQEGEKASSPYPILYLRLSSDHYSQDLANFRTLYAAAQEKRELPLVDQTIIDLRIPHLAFIKKTH